MELHEQIKLKGLNIAVTKAQSILLGSKPEQLIANHKAYTDAQLALREYEDSLKTPAQLELEKKVSELTAKLAPLQTELDEALAELQKIAPNLKVATKPRTSVATVSLTVELKARVIELKKAGKRNNEIAEITGLNNGQISPILQKAGLTYPKK